MAEKLVAFKMSNVTDKFAIIQDRIREKIFEVASNQTSIDFKSVAYLHRITEYGEEICTSSFGDFGKRFYDVAQELDLDHPDAGRLLSSFTDADDADEKFVQLLKLCSLAKEHDLNVLDGVFAKSATKSLFPNIKPGMRLLKNRQQFVRLFSNPDERNRLRLQKTARQVNLSICLQKIGDRWEDLPDLTCYERFGSFYQQQISTINARADVFKKMGFLSLFDVMQSDLKEIGPAKEHKYYGFQCIPVTIAAVILAKMHGCKLHSTSLEKTLNNHIVIPWENFDGYDFQFGNPICILGSSSEFKAVKRHVGNYNYLPTIHPAHELPVSENMQKILTYLDKFPEANFKPIFDHFIVMVPGPSWTQFASSRGALALFHFFDTLGIKHKFNNGNDARMALNTILIKEKYIVPILLGERDGKFYFICFWE